MDFLKGFDLSSWWNLQIAIGVAITIGALTAHERGLIFIGLGMIAWGFGENVNHKQMIEFIPATAYTPGGILTTHPRFPTPLGLCLDGAGLVLISLGLWKLFG